jgi:hypothetical protein
MFLGDVLGSVSRLYVRMSVVSPFVKLFVFFVFGLAMMTEGGWHKDYYATRSRRAVV